MVRAVPPIMLPWTKPFPHRSLFQEQDEGLAVEEVLSDQERPVAPCGSGGHADLGLLLDASLPEELSVCLEWFMFPSGVVIWVLGFHLDS